MPAEPYQCVSIQGSGPPVVSVLPVGSLSATSRDSAKARGSNLPSASVIADWLMKTLSFKARIWAEWASAARTRPVGATGTKAVCG